MADEMDRASEAEELFREADLSQRKPAGPAFTGFCLHCDEEVQYPRRWCDAECRDAYEYRLSRG